MARLVATGLLGLGSLAASAVANMSSVSAAHKHTREANGWAPGIKWTNVKEGAQQAAKRGQPMMVVVHNKECPQSEYLKNKFNREHDIERLSRYFVMINVHEKDISADGAAQVLKTECETPQILFFKPDGKLLQAVRNPGKEASPYTYTTTDPIVDNMKTVLGSFNVERVQSPSFQMFHKKKRSKKGKKLRHKPAIPVKYEVTDTSEERV